MSKKKRDDEARNVKVYGVSGELLPNATTQSTAEGLVSRGRADWIVKLNSDKSHIRMRPRTSIKARREYVKAREQLKKPEVSYKTLGRQVS